MVYPPRLRSLHPRCFATEYLGLYDTRRIHQSIKINVPVISRGVSFKVSNKTTFIYIVNDRVLLTSMRHWQLKYGRGSKLQPTDTNVHLLLLSEDLRTCLLPRVQYFLTLCLVNLSTILFGTSSSLPRLIWTLCFVSSLAASQKTILGFARTQLDSLDLTAEVPQIFDDACLLFQLLTNRSRYLEDLDWTVLPPGVAFANCRCSPMVNLIIVTVVNYDFILSLSSPLSQEYTFNGLCCIAWLDSRGL